MVRGARLMPIAVLAAVLAVVLTVAAGLTGCGGEPAGGGSSAEPATRPGTVSVTHTAPVPAPAPASTVAGTPRCSAASLRGAVRPEDAGAGNRYAILAVTNTGTTPCTLYGYGGLQLVDAQGNPAPTSLMRTPNPGPALVMLKPGESAGKRLRWGVVPTGDEPVTGPCQPPSAGASVIPPDETAPFTVAYDFGSICDKGRIEGSAYFKA